VPTFVPIARHVGSATLAGVIAGILVGGLLGRVVMRITGFMAGPALVGVHTSNGNRIGDITLAGTVALIFFVGVGAGLAGGVVYAALESWLRPLRPWHGLGFGVALLAAVGFTVLDPSNFDFTRFGVPWLNAVMFATLFVLFGVVIAWLFDVVRSTRERSGTLPRIVDVLAWLALVPAIAVVVLFIGGTAGLDPLVAIVMVAALLVPALVRWRGLPPAIGYASLAGVLLLGAARTLSGLPQLLAGF
jgi:hypothetical protein